MSTPEVISIFLLMNILLGKKLKLEDIIKMSLIYSIFCYIIKNVMPLGVDTILLSTLVLLLFYKHSKVNIFFTFISEFIGYGAIFILQGITVMFLNLIGINYNYITSNEIFMIIVSYIPVAITILIYYIYYKKNIDISRVKIGGKKNKNNYIIYILTPIAIITFTVFIAIVRFLKKVSSRYYTNSEFIAIFIVMLLILCIISLMLVVIITNQNRTSIEIERNLMDKNLKQLQDAVDMLRIQKHDYMNHLQVILMQISKNKNEDAKRYILNISNNINNSSVDYNTGNNYIDAVLNSKNQKCLENNIELTACVDSLIEYTDLVDTEVSAILLNIIDNAIDALKKCNKKDKYIHVDIYEDESNYYMSIQNNGDDIEDTKKIFEKGFSTNGENRGYGLFSIKKMLERYKCSIEVNSDIYETEFIITIPIKNKKSFI